jgi:hypothetical protein
VNDIAEWYREFGAREVRGVSPIYERLSFAVAGDDEILERLATLPRAKRQPNLLFGVVRLLGGPVEPVAEFRSFVLSRWETIAPEMSSRATQTNEIGRCAALLPVLAGLPQPLALVDVGASAGLLLYPDKYSYRYGTHTISGGGPVLDCDATGIDLPTRLPAIASRTGVDLNPLDVTDPADVAWLEALVWPEQTHRRDRLRAAIEIARNDPPRLVRGGLDAVPDLVAQAPAGATPVVYHCSVLYQVPPDERAAFVERVRSLPGHWISIEGPTDVQAGELPAPPDGPAVNVLALDGRPLAWVRAHGQAVFGI